VRTERFRTAMPAHAGCRKNVNNPYADEHKADPRNLNSNKRSTVGVLARVTLPGDAQHIVAALSSLSCATLLKRSIGTCQSRGSNVEAPPNGLSLLWVS
jgi:hypothetical protein